MHHGLSVLGKFSSPDSADIRYLQVFQAAGERLDHVQKARHGIGDFRPGSPP